MRTYVLALALTLLPGAVLAQQQRGPDQGMAMRGGAAGMLAQREALQLTSEQVTKLEAIEKQQQEQLAAMRAQMEQNRPQLTPEEREARRAQMQQQRAARGQMTPAERDALREQMRQRRAEVTPEQRAAMRAQMESFREQMRASSDAARAVLTEEQHAKWQELMQATHEQNARRGDRPMRGQRSGQRGLRSPPGIR